MSEKHNRVLVVCDEGNNRSVTLAHQLKYRGYDVLTAGLKRNDGNTLEMLFIWADKIIVTAKDQLARIPDEFMDKVELWNIGPDNYPRPFNKHLLSIVRGLMEQKGIAA